MGQRSTVADLPQPILSAVHAAIERGASIDSMVELIAGAGGDVSRSAMGRYSKSFASVAKQQRAMRAQAEAFGREFGGSDDYQTRMMVQLANGVLTRSIMAYAAMDDVGDEPTPMDTKELKELGQAVQAMTSAAKIDVEREARIRLEEGKRAKAEAATAADAAGRAAGASEETLRRIRAGILGIAA